MSTFLPKRLRLPDEEEPGERRNDFEDAELLEETKRVCDIAPPNGSDVVRQRDKTLARAPAEGGRRGMSQLADPKSMSPRVSVAGDWAHDGRLTCSGSALQTTGNHKGMRDVSSK